MTWTEHVPGTLWTQPLRDDTLAAKLLELNITPRDDVVTAFAQHRYVVGSDSTGNLVLVMASADDTFGLFRFEETSRKIGLDPSLGGIGGLRPIINSEGDDISGMLKAAADAAGIPLELALGCAIAESSLNPKAARYGAWPDVSFGYGQQIVLYHYLGDHTNTPANIAAVRDAVFADPQGNLNDMCLRLKSDLQRVQDLDLSPVGGDQMLAVLVVYNSGGWHKAADPWWGEWAENVKNYRKALVKAREMLA